MRGLQVDRAVGQMALGALADLVQQRLAGERHEPQHDHRRARELVLVAAPEIAVGLEHVQVGVRGDALDSAPVHDPTSRRSAVNQSNHMPVNDSWQTALDSIFIDSTAPSRF